MGLVGTGGGVLVLDFLLGSMFCLDVDLPCRDFLVGPLADGSVSEDGGDTCGLSAGLMARSKSLRRACSSWILWSVVM